MLNMPKNLKKITFFAIFLAFFKKTPAEKNLPA